MKILHELYKKILDEGFTHGDRTGVGRRSIYNVHLDFDVSEYFPVPTTQKVFLQTAVKETLWMLKGRGNINIPELELPIWKQWTLQESSIDKHTDLIKQLCAKQEGYECSDYYVEEAKEHIKNTKLGTIGNIYPQSWRFAPNNNISIRPQRTLDELPSDLVNGRSEELLTQLNATYWQHYDQINEVFLNIKKRPYSSRHRVSAWIPEWLPDEDKDSQYNIINNRGALTPCHSFFQFTVGAKCNKTGKDTLNLHLMQASSDTPVGLLYNIAGYSVLLHIFAHLLGMKANRFSATLGDAHIYTNQIEFVKEQLTRQIYEPSTKLIIKDRCQKDPFDFLPSDFSFEGYVSHPHLKYPVAV